MNTLPKSCISWGCITTPVKRTRMRLQVAVELLPLIQVLLLVEMEVVRLSLLLWHRFKSGIRALCAVEQGCVLPVKAKARTGTATATSYALHATAICIAKNVMAEKATTPQNTDNQNVNSTILPLSPRIKHLGAMGEHYFLQESFKFKCKLKHTKWTVLLICFKMR